jgi:hypothetical protein
MKRLRFFGASDGNWEVMVSGAQTPGEGISADGNVMESYEPSFRGMRLGIADDELFFGGWVCSDLTAKTIRISLIKHRFANKISARNPLISSSIMVAYRRILRLCFEAHFDAEG